MEKQDKQEMPEQLKVEMESQNASGDLFKTEQQIKVPPGKTVEQVKEAMNQSILRMVEWDKEKIAQSLEEVEKELLAQENLFTHYTRMHQDVKKSKQNLRNKIQRLRHNKFDKKGKRFNRVHKFIKSKLMYPGLKFVAKRMGPYLVKSLRDFDKRWNNNFIRMWYWSWKKGLDDMWIYMHREMNPQRKAQYETPSRYLQAFIPWRYKDSDWSRRLAVDIAATEILEDSIDREWFNFSILNLVHQVMEFYKIPKKQRDKVPRAGDGKFPVYDMGNEYSPKYFIENMDYPVWEEPEEYDYDKEEQERKQKEVEHQNQERRKNSN